MFGETQDKTGSPELLSTSNLSAGFSPSVTIIETRTLFRECLARCLQEKLELPVLTYRDVESWSHDPAGASACLIILGRLDDERPEAIRELAQWEKDVPVVVFSDSDSRNDVAVSLRSGAKGFIPSDTPLEVVAKAIKLVLVGGVFAPASVFLDPEPEPLRPEAKLDFTAREKDVVQALLKGKSNKVIAFDLSMSESSVKVHVRNVMRKLQVRNRTEAVIKIAELSRRDGDRTAGEAQQRCA